MKNFRTNMISHIAYVVLNLSLVLAQDEPNLLMFTIVEHLYPTTKSGEVLCVAEGSAATASIIWSRYTYVAAPEWTSDFLFQSTFPKDECLESQGSDFCPGPLKNTDGWTVETSLNWNLPPLLYYRWEKLPYVLTRKYNVNDYSLPLPKAAWSVGVSVRVNNNAEIFLCNEGSSHCYFVRVTGDRIDYKHQTWVRRCEGRVLFDNWKRNVTRNCEPTVTEHKGRIGVRDEWLHLRLDWSQDGGNLKLFFRDKDSSYKLLIDYNDLETPLNVSYLTLWSPYQEAEWRIHHYEVLSLMTSSPDNAAIKTDWYQPRADKHCISFFYVIYPGHALNATLLIQRDNKDIEVQLLGVLAGDVTQELEWREARFILNHPTFHTGNDVMYDFQVRGILGDNRTGHNLAAAIESVRECDPRGDVRVSRKSNSDECYLLTNPGTKVRFREAEMEASTSQEALKGGRLCERVHNEQTCRKTIMCRSGSCACAPGYLGPSCDEECGWDEYRNTYGPGCSEVCGNCTEPQWIDTNVCHHVTGECVTNKCVGDLEPPLCKFTRSELPTSTSTPEAKATNSVTVLVTITIGGTVVASIVLLLLILVLVTKRRQERKLRDELMLIFESGVAESFNPRLPLDEQADVLPYSQRWEFPRDRLKLGEQLGAGAFGVVLKGEAVCIQGGEGITTVAVKMVKRNAGLTHIKNLASELKIMAHLGQHLNVVNFLGACTKNLDKRDLLVIVEFCRYGNLHNYLLRHRADFIDQIDPNTGLIDPTVGTDIIDEFKAKERQASLDVTASSGRDDLVVKYQSSGNEGLHLDTTPIFTGLKNAASQLTPTINSNRVAPAGSDFHVVFEKKECPICTKDLLSWAFHVARGMEYLSERKVLHGDLAARNILLADDNVVKICDFGLSKSVYSSSNYLKKGNERLPLKWMAIESIQDKIFSTQSDVWSYGIVLWEFFSLGRTPYPGLETYDELYSKLQTGYRMEKPEHGTEKIHAVMQRCWELEPSVRPSFSDLVELVGDMLEESVRAHYVDLNEPYVTMNRLSRADEGDYPNLVRTSSGGETEVTGGGEG